MSLGWHVDCRQGEPFPILETKGIAADILLLHHAAQFLLTPWQYSFLSRVRPPGVAMNDRERMLIRRIWEDSIEFDWSWPEMEEQPFVVAERAAKRALGLDGVKRTKRRDKGEPKPKKLTRQEADFDCPVCRTGAHIRAWNNGAGNVIFFCQNRRCVRKMPHHQGWHPEREQKISEKRIGQV